MLNRAFRHIHVPPTPENRPPFGVLYVHSRCFGPQAHIELEIRFRRSFKILVHLSWSKLEVLRVKGWCGTVEHMDVRNEPTWTYSRRVPCHPFTLRADCKEPAQIRFNQHKIRPCKLSPK